MQWSGIKKGWNGATTQNILEKFLPETWKMGVFYPLYPAPYWLSVGEVMHRLSTLAGSHAQKYKSTKKARSS